LIRREPFTLTAALGIQQLRSRLSILCRSVNS
jgi:hypothetical protein